MGDADLFGDVQSAIKIVRSFDQSRLVVRKSQALKCAFPLYFLGL